MNWRSEKGKSSLIKMLMRQHGISKRKAEEAVNAVFYCMTRALYRGERVELPIGWIQAELDKRPNAHQKFRNIQDGKVFYRLVRRRKRKICFKPDPELILKLPAEPTSAPAPLNPDLERKAAELEELLSRLGFAHFTLPELKQLMAAAKEDLDTLLARLRQVIKDEHQFQSFDVLVATVRQLYWIRKGL